MTSCLGLQGGGRARTQHTCILCIVHVLRFRFMLFTDYQASTYALIVHTRDFEIMLKYGAGC